MAGRLEVRVAGDSTGRDSAHDSSIQPRAWRQPPTLSGPDAMLLSCPAPRPAACLALARRRAAQTRVLIQAENVRIEYAQVLNAEPVYQTLRATSMVSAATVDARPARAAARGLSRMVGAVKDVAHAARRQVTRMPTRTADGSPSRGRCRMVPVEREFRRPIAYDVDYVYKGSQVPLAPALRPRQPPAHPGLGDALRPRTEPRLMPCGAAPLHATMRAHDAEPAHAAIADAPPAWPRA